MADTLTIDNGVPVSRQAIPELAFARFAETLSERIGKHGFVVHFFAWKERQNNKLLAVFRDKGLHVLATSVGAEYPSLTRSCSEKFHLFEREIAEQYGIEPLGHPSLKMVRYHPNYAGGKDLFGNDYSHDIPGNYPYFRVRGEAVHEVAVGPVHAGIIEPGHFRFQCIGEEVLSLEIQLGYQHRGVEKMLTAVPQARLPIICEAIAGDTAIGHNLCCCQALEALAGREVPRSARIVRTIAMELERIANHLGDLGALSGDVAFGPPAAYFGRLRGEFLNLLLVLCGNRFGKSLVRPGGISQPVGKEQRELIMAKIVETEPEIASVCDLLFSAHTVLARFETTGTVERETAATLGLVGCCARASGLSYDARIALPTEAYDDLPPERISMTAGDVLSRAMVRREEIFQSLAMIKELLRMLGDASPSAWKGQDTLAPDSLVVTVNEGWRGELSHCVLTDETGKISRYKVKDPSFHNWTGLAMALRNQEISDFPLCNKSFNLSYCGFDL